MLSSWWLSLSQALPIVEQSWFSLNHFIEQGGPVLLWLAAVVILSWCLVIDRLIFLIWIFPKMKKQWLICWQQRSDKDSWYATSLRNGWLNDAHILLFQHLNLIKVLVAICPMLGLLGTVTGMISVFDVMATQGSSEPQLMASGISLATLPTMAGMVAALAGLFVHSRLQKACCKQQHQLEKMLRSA